MRVGDTPLGQLTAEHIQALMDSGTRENEVLDYKQQAPAATDDSGKRRLVEHVAAMANARGGVILFGIEEERSTGVPKCVVGVGDANLDQLELRLRQTVQNGLHPKVPTLAFREVDMGEGVVVLALGVGESFVGPHEVRENRGRYFRRRGNQKMPMDWQELREAFGATAAWQEEALAFHHRREARRGAHAPRYVLHVLPVGRLDEWSGLPISDHATELGRLVSQHLQLSSPGYLLHGLSSRSHFDERLQEDFTWLRFGAVEYVSLTQWVRKASHGPGHIVQSGRLAQQLERAITAASLGLRLMDIGPPYGLFLTFRFDQTAWLEFGRPATGDYERLTGEGLVLALNPSILETDSHAPVDAVAPMLHQLAQAAGRAAYPLPEERNARR